MASMNEQGGRLRSVQGSPGPDAAASPGGRAPVVAGVDGSAAALDAVEWAAAEAAARQSPLHIVHVFTWPAPIDPTGLMTAASVCAYQAAAEQIVEEAVVRARVVASEVRVTPRLVIGNVGRALVEQAMDADLLVLGRGSRQLRSRLRRSVDVEVVKHATCPVAVVNPFRAVPPGPSAARVVVGVDGSTQSIAAIGYAYKAAAQRGIGLTAIHAWSPRRADHQGVVSDVAAAEEVERQVLHRALDGWTSTFPGVPVEARLVRDCPARALLTESAGAALTVLGSSRRNRAGGAAVPGPTSQMLIRHARSPVAVLHSTPSCVPS